MPTLEKFEGKTLTQIVAEAKLGQDPNINGGVHNGLVPLTREIDEHYAGGFWDYSADIANKLSTVLSDKDLEMLQEDIYNSFWEIFEATNK